MTAEGEAFKKKKDGKEPAYLIYRTIECLLLIVFMHKVSKKSQIASDTFPFVKMPVSVYQMSSYSHKNRHSHKRDSNMKIRKQLEKKRSY